MCSGDADGRDEISSTLKTVVSDCTSLTFVEISFTKEPMTMSQAQFASIESMNAMIVKLCSAMNVVLNVDPPHPTRLGPTSASHCAEPLSLHRFCRSLTLCRHS